jgi:pimeloyl-ACP methyl ester carboxylesterase
VTPGGLPETWREIHHIEHPTLLIWGRDDLTNPLDGALFPMKQMPNARLYVISDCGHWAQVEYREEFDRIVTSFLTLDQ